MNRPHLRTIGLLVAAAWAALLVAAAPLGVRRSAAESPPPDERAPRVLGLAAVPPQDVPWFACNLEGGPVFGIGVSQLASGGQLVFAGGHETFVSRNGGASWFLPRATGEVANLVAGPDGVAFVASAEGMGQRTTNSGRQWYATRLRGDAPVWFLAVSPDFRRDQVAYGITRDDWRLYRMEKGGSSWTEVVIELDATPRFQFGAVAFSPHYALDGTMFVGTDRGVYKTEDGGRDWRLVGGPASGAPVFGAAGGDVAQQGLVVPREYGDDPARRFDRDLRHVFAYNRSGLYLSQDDGLTWQRLPLEAERIQGVAVSNAWASDPVIMAAITGRQGEVVAVSADGGTTWRHFPGKDGIVGTAIAMDVEFSYVPAEVDPERKILFVPYLLRDWVPGAPFPPPRPTPPPYLGTRKAYLATDGDGVWCTADAGRSWGRCVRGLGNARATALVFLPDGSDADALAGTRGSGLYRSIDGGRTWRWLDSGLPRGADETIHVIRRSPQFASDRTIFLAATSGVWRSQDGGGSWERTSGPAPAASLALSPAYGTDRTLAAAGHLSTDGGQTWRQLGVDGTWTAVAFSTRFDSDRTIYAGQLLPATGLGNMLTVSRDRGETWTSVEHSQLRNRSIYALHTLSVTPADPVRIFVGTDRGLVYSHDGGRTWTQNSSMSRAAYDMVSQPTQDERYGQTAVVLAVGEQGAQWSMDRGLNWVNRPAIGLPVHAAAISTDATVMLVARSVGISRYGVGSARVFAPIAQRD